MEEINVFVRAATLEVPPPQAAPEDLYDILPRQGQAIAAGPATFATSGRRVTLTAATSHFPGTGRPQPSASSNRTPSSQSPALTTSVPRPVATTPLVPLAPVLETSNIRSSPLATTLPTLSPVSSQPSVIPSQPSPVPIRPSPVPNQSSPVQPSPIPSRVSSEQEQNGAQSSSAAPATATPAGTDAGVIVGAILLVLVAIAILAAVILFIKKRVKGGGQPKGTTESFDFDPPSRTNPNLSKAEAAAMAELMRIAYRVENEPDDDAARGGRDTYYAGGQGSTDEKRRSSFLGGRPEGTARGAGVTSPYQESQQANNVARMQSLGSESVAQLGLRHPVGRWVHVERPGGAGAERTSAYNVPDVPAVPGFTDRYSTSDVYSGMAR
ncbi:hypothetical protein Daus18300_001027 [Diaporthe australafricana]|uniref:Uncharacterized protein n=1 Tax=Diaporthe australafricana TaxID=127596 RepID=A0ABR3XYT5_9PEZI